MESELEIKSNEIRRLHEVCERQKAEFDRDLNDLYSYLKEQQGNYKPSGTGVLFKNLIAFVIRIKDKYKTT